MAGKFFDNFQESAGGGSFIGKEEKATLIKDATPLTVQAVRKGESKFGLRYVVDVDLDGEIRSLSFTADSVESRDRMLDAMTQYLEDPEAEKPVVKLVVPGPGPSVVITSAEE